MAVGWGADPTKNNNVVTQGTSAEDVRKVWGALYNTGIITGAVVTPSTTDRTYTVTAGVGVISISSGENVMVPIPFTVVPAVAPTNRTDIIYAKQNLPSVDGNSLVVVGVASTLPDNAIELSKFIVESTDTTASAGVRTGGIDYAVPYGATGKILYQWRDTSDATIPSTDKISAGNGSFHIPTDRNVEISMRACLSASGATGFDNSKYCEVLYQIVYDGRIIFSWSSGGLHQAWTTYEFASVFPMTAGTHTIHYTYQKLVGPGTPVRHFHGVNGWPGTLLLLRDAGVID